jgi:hypothetical protein
MTIGSVTWALGAPLAGIAAAGLAESNQPERPRKNGRVDSLGRQ